MQLLLKRNSDLTPTPDEQTNLVNLVSKVQIVLENLTLNPAGFDACQIEEVRQVGSFKRGTMLTGKNKADIVVILKTLPIIEAVKSLQARVLEDLAKIETSTPAASFTAEMVDGGFELTNVETGSIACILFTTIMPNFRKIDNNVHFSSKLMQKHMSSIRHVRWFEESANLTSIKVLVRIFKDMSQRFEGFKMLTPWMIDVLVHYAVTFRNSQQLLALNTAFKRILQLLAGGIFLPGSASIPDPCENGAITLHSPLSLTQQDLLCTTAQTLLRVLSHSRNYKIALGLEPDNIGIVDNMSVWNDVMVLPGNKAYEGIKRDEKPPAVVANDVKPSDNGTT